jgi:hypothetical protein
MVARVTATSKCREKVKEPILAEEPEEVPPPYVPLYPPLPPAPSSAPLPPTFDGEARGIVTPVKPGSEDSGTLTPLTFLSPMDPIPTLNPPVLTPHSPFNWEYLTSLCEDPSSPQTPAALQMLLREAQNPMYYDQKGQIQGGGRVLSISPLPPQTSSTGSITPLLSWKSLKI